MNHWVLFHLLNCTYCAWIRISYHLRPNPLCQHGLVQSLVAVRWLGRLGGKAIMANKSTCWQLVGALHCWSAFGSWGQWRSSSPCPSELPTCPRGSQCCGTGCPWSTKKGHWKKKGGRRPFHKFLCNQKLLRGGDIYHKSIWVCRSLSSRDVPGNTFRIVDIGSVTIHSSLLVIGGWLLPHNMERKARLQPFWYSSLFPGSQSITL